MNNRLYVGNLAFTTSEGDLQDAFGAHGTVSEVHIMMDRMTQRSRGFAFVTMATPEDAERAIAGMHGKSLDGRELTVNIARPREERGGFGGGPSRGSKFAGGGGRGGRRY